MARFSGPFGIWPFPILNTILGLVQGYKGGSHYPSSQSSQPVLSNIETIKWTDWKGRPREIEIHREVTAPG